MNLTHNKSHGCTVNALKRRAAIPTPPPVEHAVWVPLSKGLFALVDASDYEKVQNVTWSAVVVSTTHYAAHYQWISGKLTSTFLHRFLMDAPDDLEVDHKNGKGWDCRKHNMRLCSRLQNGRNYSRWKKKVSSKYKGVQPSRSRWQAAIKVNGGTLCLGTFDSELEAAQAYDSAAKLHFGEFAKLNFP